MRSVLCAVAVVVAGPVFAAHGTAVRQIDAKNLRVAVSGSGETAKQQIVIRTADDLAASTVFLDAASRTAVLGQVNFAKEKVVVITWRGSSSSAARASVSRCGKKVAFIIVTSDPALADLRPHAAVFAVPLDMVVEPESPRNPIPVSLHDVTIDYSKGGHEPRPLEITSAEELATAGVFADAASRATIKGRIDFSTDKLVVFAWGGSRRDKLTTGTDGDGKFAVFTYTAGVTDDLHRHAYAFAVPRDCGVKVTK